MRRLVAGVRYIHSQRVIHRDLKLGNMLLDEGMELKIADFGLATRVEYEGEKKMYVKRLFIYLSLFYFCRHCLKQERQHVTVRPGNAHFIFFRQVSSDVPRCSCAAARHVSALLYGSPPLLVILLCITCMQLDD